MKRQDLIRRLEDSGCILVRQRGPHDWWRNPRTGMSQPVPRHRDINEYLARHILKNRFAVMKNWKPTTQQINSAPEHIAWEYVALLAAALQMAKGHDAPVNHEVQEAFLAHLRNLAEFFRCGVEEFKSDPSGPPARRQDNIYAVDLCSTVYWNEKPFSDTTELLRAINKTLSHMTYSRDLSPGNSSEIRRPFDGCNHLHGTVRLVRGAWEDFLRSLRAEYQTDLQRWLNKHAHGMRVPLVDFDERFEALARQWSHWRFNETPDGPI